MPNIENLKKVREYVANGKEENFNMASLFSEAGCPFADLNDTKRLGLNLVQTAQDQHVLFGDCESAGCIAGWALLAAADAGKLSAEDLPGCSDSLVPWFDRAADFLGLDYDDADTLFLGEEDVDTIAGANITREEVLETLDWLIETGEVSWPERVRGALGY